MRKRENELFTYFYDIVKDEYGTWTQICKKHSKDKAPYSFGKLVDCAAENTICDCTGCQNKAE